MRSMVVFFALAAVACGSLVPIAQPPHHPAIVLDPHGRPLDTAEVIGARALHLQAKALEGHYGYGHLVHAAPLAHSYIATPSVYAHAAPVWGAHAALLGHSAYGLTGHGHYLKKRSLGHLAYSAPIIAPSAVSHQSRVDVISSPAVVSHAYAAPVVSHAVAAPVVAHATFPAAVSHQSRVDVRTSPAVVSHSVVAAPVLAAHSAWATPVYGAHSLGISHGHLLKKRSLAFGHSVVAPVFSHAFAPSAVSHQSRVDVISSPAVVSHVVAAPVLAHAVAAPVVAHTTFPAAVSQQSRVDVISSADHVVPYAHSAVWTAPASHLSHSSLLHHSSPLGYAAGHW